MASVNLMKVKLIKNSTSKRQVLVNINSAVVVMEANVPHVNKIGVKKKSIEKLSFKLKMII